MRNDECRMQNQEDMPPFYLCRSPLPLRTISLLMRCRASATFWALLIFAKSGEPSARLGKPPSPEATGIRGAATAGAWPLRGAGNDDVDSVTFGFGVAAA